MDVQGHCSKAYVVRVARPSEEAVAHKLRHGARSASRAIATTVGQRGGEMSSWRCAKRLLMRFSSDSTASIRRESPTTASARRPTVEEDAAAPLSLLLASSRAPPSVASVKRLYRIVCFGRDAKSSKLSSTTTVGTPQCVSVSRRKCLHFCLCVHSKREIDSIVG